jgi:geranylgeranyl diphosphate synthase type II
MLPSWYGEYRDLIEKNIFSYLDKYIEKNNSNNWLETFRNVLFYANQGWKKIRSLLALEFYLCLTWSDINQIKENDDIIKIAVAIELLHAYSLVHDDLPCMDNDEYRRGLQTCWKKYWEYNAVLAWDLLNTLAYEILSDMDNSEHAIEVIKLLSSHTWFNGMIWGQISDMFFELDTEKLSYSDLIELHNKKTGQLIKASVLCWIIAAWKSHKTDEFKRFWEKIWLAFQIKDDLLDVEGTFEETWKSVGLRDGWEFEQKWFVYFMWIQKTKIELESLIIDCKNVANKLWSEKLEFLVEYIANRKK